MSYVHYLALEVCIGAFLINAHLVVFVVHIAIGLGPSVLRRLKQIDLEFMKQLHEKVNGLILVLRVDVYVCR